MRAHYVFFSALIVGGATAGCFDFLSNPDDFIQGTGGQSGAGGSTGGGGEGGGTTTAPPECIPDGTSSPVENECGVFVSSSKGDDTGGTGTKDKPVATLGRALELAKSKPIYMCAETFNGPIQLDGSALVYGGLDCAGDWGYVGGTTPTDITAGPDAIPLHVGTSVNLEMYDVRVIAQDAAAAGSSSIGLLAEAAAKLLLTRCSVEAGNGAPAASADDQPGQGAEGAPGNAGSEACSAGTVVGGDSPLNECGATDSLGGLGGIGTMNAGGPGGPGDPGSGTNDNAGGGEGAANQCGHGQVGLPGAAGAAGAGATGLGELGVSGLAAAAGSDGMPGAPGQGGGGGGGAKGGTGGGKCSSAGSAGGASGGSGGAGGCGGAGGKGGAGGGSSIALVSLGAQLVFKDVTLVAKAGGAGGNGGGGQAGGTGGAGGAAGLKGGAQNLNDACHGGDGGSGGGGGRGGGGRGGHSIGVAHTGAAPSLDGAMITVGAPGLGGTGDNGVAESNGAEGVAEQTQAF